MHGPTVQGDAPRDRVSVDLEAIPLTEFNHLWAARSACGDLVFLAVAAGQQTLVRFAQPDGPFQYRFENRREVAGRAVDNPQHLGGRRPLLQSLVALGRALSQLPKGFVPLGSALGEIALKIGNCKRPTPSVFGGRTRGGRRTRRLAKTCVVRANSDTCGLIAVVEQDQVFRTCHAR